jgi:glycosyltransferase involved in cell wall biosynthesis
LLVLRAKPKSGLSVLKEEITLPIMLEDVVVLIAHYNDPEGLEHTLDSIKEDEKVKVVVVDDGSELKPDVNYLKQRFSDKLDLTVLFKEYNSGPEDSANYGLLFIYNEMPECRYIARLDCKDLCMPYRLSKQKHFFTEHPGVMLVGGWVDFYNNLGQFLYCYAPPADYKKIKKEIFLSAVFIQPVVMIQRAALEEIGGYPNKYPTADDYALYFEITKRYPTAVLPEVLLKTIFDDKGVSLGNRKKQLRSRMRILWDNKSVLNPYWWLGIIKLTTLMFLPYSLISKIKQLVYRK